MQSAAAKYVIGRLQSCPFFNFSVLESVHAFSNACKNERVFEGAESCTTRVQTPREEDNYVSWLSDNKVSFIWKRIDFHSRFYICSGRTFYRKEWLMGGWLNEIEKMPHIQIFTVQFKEFVKQKKSITSNMYGAKSQRQLYQSPSRIQFNGKLITKIIINSNV